MERYREGSNLVRPEISSILVYGEVWAREIEGGGGFS